MRGFQWPLGFSRISLCSGYPVAGQPAGSVTQTCYGSSDHHHNTWVPLLQTGGFCFPSLSYLLLHLSVQDSAHLWKYTIISNWILQKISITKNSLRFENIVELISFECFHCSPVHHGQSQNNCQLTSNCLCRQTEGSVALRSFYIFPF